MALRKAFPEELGGLYTTEEMGQADADAENSQDNPQQQRNGRGDRGNAPAGASSVEQTVGWHPAGTTVKSPSSPAPAHGEQASTGNGGKTKEKGNPEATNAAGGGPGNGKKPAADLPPDSPVAHLIEEFRKADRYGRLKMFQEMKKDINELTGDDTEYYRILNRHGVEKSDQFKDVQTAKQCIAELFTFLAAYQKALEPDPEPMSPSTDDREDWLPEVMQKEQVSA